MATIKHLLYDDMKHDSDKSKILKKSTILQHLETALKSIDECVARECTL